MTDDMRREREGNEEEVKRSKRSIYKIELNRLLDFEPFIIMETIVERKQVRPAKHIAQMMARKHKSDSVMRDHRIIS